MSEWKSPKDEMPSDRQYVLTATGLKSGRVSYSVMYHRIREDGSSLWVAEREYFIDYPTYWMPLPPLPEVNEDE